jgi:sensor histidine kinase YesM
MKWTRWKSATVVLGVATLIGLAEAAQVYVGVGARGQGIPWTLALTSTMPSWYVWAVLLPAALWLAGRFRLDSEKWRGAFLFHLIASVAFTAIHIVASSWLSDYVLLPGEHPPFLDNLTRLFTMYFVVDTLFYWALVGGYYAIEYGTRVRERERATAELALKASRLETSLSRANLEALRMQLNPHFLFNTLNTIAVLSMKGERQRVVRMINRLSDLLRLSLENSRQTITLGEEVDFLQRYLEIEQVRFRDRLTVHVDVPDDLLDAEVPSLILQPVAENAVLHGISKLREGGAIEISARRLDGHLVLNVQDTGPGFPDEVVEEGVGLSNTAARLDQLYGHDHDFKRSNRPEGGAVVTMTIPYRVVTRDVQEEREWKRSAL